MNEMRLPVITDSVLPWIENVTQKLNVPRAVLASDECIKRVWDNLPSELQNIPPDLRNELIARMCVAIANGLFDGAINYIWNCSVANLRNKLITYGIPLVAQVKNEPDFSETDVNELKDAELLSLCLKLNLISEDGYFFLNQCRDIRNNFSAAHPNLNLIDDAELINFIRRCSKYALATSVNPRGIDMNEFVKEIKRQKFTQIQEEAWIGKIDATHDAQRELLFSTLHGMYCDPKSGEETRSNAIAICEHYSEAFSYKAKSELINRHSEYRTKGDEKRYEASKVFFSKLHLTSLLDDSERHEIISRACKKLYSVHMAFDNFYNEPAFAERLGDLSDMAIPNTAKNEYVFVILLCYVGNPYGVSRAAIPYYERMIKNFSPQEIQIMLNLDNQSEDNLLKRRMNAYPQCRNRFKEAVKLLDQRSIPKTSQRRYAGWIAG